MIPKTGNDTTPLELGWYYLVTPGGASQQWVEIIDISPNDVIFVAGLDNTIATWFLPDWHFDDIIVGYKKGGMFLITEDSLFDIITEDGEALLGQ